MNYELWRPALIAFYKADRWFISAESLEKFNAPLSDQDKRLIEALAASFKLAPSEQMRRAA